MRFFELKNLQHVMLYLLPTLVFLLVFGAGLGSPANAAKAERIAAIS